MSAPAAAQSGGTRQQVYDTCASRIRIIAAEQRELLTRLRRLSAERADLEAALAAVGVETEQAEPSNGPTP